MKFCRNFMVCVYIGHRLGGKGVSQFVEKFLKIPIIFLFGKIVIKMVFYQAYFSDVYRNNHPKYVEKAEIL